MFRMLGCKSTGAHANEIDHNLLYQALFFLGGGGGGGGHREEGLGKIEATVEL